MNARPHQIELHKVFQPRAGFTLVEMLVATGLVVMIMLMFAQIYSTAIGTISEQRGIGNNDQKARILSTILHNDLENITYRQTSPEYGTAAGIVPLMAGDEAILDKENQLGYFYLSENDPSNPTDDVLQFTAKVQDSDYDNWYIGKAAELTDPDFVPPTSPDAAYRNQPNKDGGPSNAPGQSRFAEISYFLRRGTLYRRVLLLRDAGGQDEQPGNGTADRHFGESSVGVQAYSNFWRDFDYSATRVFVGPDSGSGFSYPWFNGKSSLLNTSATADSQPLGLPWNRFGHFNDYVQSPNQLYRGCPREFTMDDPSSVFIGRFTQEETASEASNAIAYPGKEDTLGYFRRNVNLPWDNNTGTVNGLSDADRLGEDVVLTNVEAFDIEVWEPSLEAFVQLGYDGAGKFSSQGRTNSGYGPRSSQNNIFDTWHPDIRNTDTVDEGQTFVPPYRPVVQGGVPVVRMTNINAASPTTFNGQLNGWSANTSYEVGDRIKIQAIQTATGNYNDSLSYEVIAVGGDPTLGIDGTSGSTPPSFPPIPNMIVQDGDLTWKCVDNRVGLQAIRITIRYVDLQSKLPRQVTVVHSFMKSRPK